MKPEDNELMCRVEGDAPMGRVLREHCWIPALHSDKLLAGDSPQRIRLLGRNYVLFRGESGHVGCFDEACPHRGVSLALGRIEGDALRCIYHGWKYALTGETLEVPTQTHDHDKFCKLVRIGRHPVHEAGGIIWLWLGDGDTPPVFPDLEFLRLPPEQSQSVRQEINYNWVAGVEGTMDSSHVSILHQSKVGAVGAGIANTALNAAPRFDIEEQKTGFRYAALREMADGRTYTRVNVFALPWFGFICPSEPGGDALVEFWVPIDDEHTIHWQFAYNPDRSVTSEWLLDCEDRGNYPPVPGPAEQHWGQDRAAMKAGNFTGFHHLLTEDFAVAASQGAFADRSKEFLNTGDLAIVRVRRQLLEQARAAAEAQLPAIASFSAEDYALLRPASGTLEPGEAWRDRIGVPPVAATEVPA